MRWLNKIVNKQVIRAFSFIPALGWREVPVEEVKHFFRHNLDKMKVDDRASYRRTCDGKLVCFIIAFYGNENKKDVNYVKGILKDALYKHEKAMKGAA